MTSITPHRFISTIKNSADYNSFYDSEYFKEYHFYERFDSNKPYQTGLFEHDYGKGKHTYQLKFYIVWLFKYVEGKGWESRFPLKYVIAEENISNDELKDLSKYCQCPDCKASKTASSWFNFTKHFTCQQHQHYDCIKVNETILVHQSGIDKAREAQQNIL